MRIAIAGSPQSGKTTLSKTLNQKRAKCTDDLVNLGWSGASEAVSYWFDDLGIDVIEGVAVPRALRKWLKNNDTGKPVDKIIYLNNPYVKLTKGQRTMAKGCRTVWDEIKPELLRRDVIIEDDVSKEEKYNKIWRSIM